MDSALTKLNERCFSVFNELKSSLYLNEYFNIKRIVEVSVWSLCKLSKWRPFYSGRVG